MCVVYSELLPLAGRYLDKGGIQDKSEQTYTAQYMHTHTHTEECVVAFHPDTDQSFPFKFPQTKKKKYFKFAFTGFSLPPDSLFLTRAQK